MLSPRANGRRSGEFRFLIQCTSKRGGCDANLEGGGCAQRLISQQQDPVNLKGQPEEVTHHLTIFYPKFHCELNFIERFWCAAKWNAREHCKYSLDGLRKGLPAVFSSVASVSVNRYYNCCVGAADAYTEGFKYGTKAFIERVYKNYRQVVDKRKW